MSDRLILPPGGGRRIEGAGMTPQGGCRKHDHLGFAVPLRLRSDGASCA